MSQFLSQHARRTKAFRRQRLYGLKLGNAISRRGNWGPHMHPTTMWLSKQAGTAGPEDP